MLLLNIDQFRVNVDSARYIVNAFHSNVLLLNLLTGDKEGRILALPKMLCVRGDGNLHIQGFTRM